MAPIIGDWQLPLTKPRHEKSFPDRSYVELLYEDPLDNIHPRQITPMLRQNGTIRSCTKSSITEGALRVPPWVSTADLDVTSAQGQYSHRHLSLWASTLSYKLVCQDTLIDRQKVEPQLLRPTESHQGTTNIWASECQQSVTNLSVRTK